MTNPFDFGTLTKWLIDSLEITTRSVGADAPLKNLARASGCE
jgi:hypothetical protein